MQVMTEKCIPLELALIQATGMTSGLSELGKRLADARLNLQISQGELSRRAGLRPETISRWESGAIPRIPELLAVARALGVSVDWLLGEPRATKLLEDVPPDQAVDVQWAAEEAKLGEDGTRKLQAARHLVGPMSRLELLTMASRIAENAARPKSEPPVSPARTSTGKRIRQ